MLNYKSDVKIDMTDEYLIRRVDYQIYVLQLIFPVAGFPVIRVPPTPECIHYDVIMFPENWGQMKTYSHKLSQYYCGIFSPT